MHIISSDRSPWRRAQHVCCLLAGFVLCLISSPAQAQEGREWKPPSEWTQLEWGLVGASVVTLSTTSMATVVVGIKENQLQRKIDRYKRYVWLRDYLEHNEVALLQDLAIGAGPVLDDLVGQLYRGEDLESATFETLRAHHTHISALLAQENSIERAALLLDMFDEVLGLHAHEEHALVSPQGGLP